MLYWCQMISDSASAWGKYCVKTIFNAHDQETSTESSVALRGRFCVKTRFNAHGQETSIKSSVALVGSCVLNEIQRS